MLEIDRQAEQLLGKCDTGAVPAGVEDDEEIRCPPFLNTSFLEERGLWNNFMPLSRRVLMTIIGARLRAGPLRKRVVM
jgi:hypothetical protein